MHLVVVCVALEVVDGVLPVGCEDVLVLPVETLVHVRPCSRVQLRGGKALGGYLGSMMTSVSWFVGVRKG